MGATATRLVPGVLLARRVARLVGLETAKGKAMTWRAKARKYRANLASDDSREQRRKERLEAIQNAPTCARCGLRVEGEHECLPRAEGFLRERNGNRSY